MAVFWICRKWIIMFSLHSSFPFPPFLPSLIQSPTPTPRSSLPHSCTLLNDENLNRNWLKFEISLLRCLFCIVWSPIEMGYYQRNITLCWWWQTWCKMKMVQKTTDWLHSGKVKVFIKHIYTTSALIGQYTCSGSEYPTQKFSRHRCLYFIKQIPNDFPNT